MKSNLKTTGLRYWMLRVLAECDKVAADFTADPVHDLRVSIRRCRSLADGMIAMDPEPAWKEMKKAGKHLFQQLGALRDVQIMMEWIERLEEGMPHTIISPESSSPLTPITQNSQPEADHGKSMDPKESPRDTVSQALVQVLKARETDHKRAARAALEQFDRKQWRQWSRSLPIRLARVRLGSPVFKHLALERWTAARELHVRAMRNRSQVALHTLRIGVKRLRYIVENFLPAEHKAWSDDMKHLQDLLGEVHDLDVLWATASSCHVFPDESSRKAWHALIVEERIKRIDEYRSRTTGPDSLWNIWRAGLPQGKEIQAIATQRMKLWAKALDPDFAHSERVARLSLQLYDGLNSIRWLGKPAPANGESTDPRVSLYAAALLHDVGKAKGKKGHHKDSLEMIKKHGTPLGWKQENICQAGLVARFHAGALPSRSHRDLRDLLPDEQTVVIRLAAILRLANALDAAHDGQIRAIRIENGSSSKVRQRSDGFLRKPSALGKNEAVVIAADGYAERTATAQAVAAERYLLETVLGRPVIVKPSSSFRRPSSSLRNGSSR